MAWGLAAALAAGCGRTPDIPSAESRGLVTTDPITPACDTPALPAFAIDTLARGLEVPWDVAFLPGGGALLTERPGRIRRIDAEGRLDPEPWAVVDGLASEEVGLMGIDTRVADDGGLQVYVAAAFDHAGGSAAVRAAKGLVRRVARLLHPAWGHPRSLQVLRYEVDPASGAAGPPRPLARIVPQGSLHGGGALAFGPDGHLYLTNGDGADPAPTLRDDAWGGRLLRFTPEGAAAPLQASDRVPAVVRGLRNSQAFSFSPDGGRIAMLDHGPTGMVNDGGRVGNDEFNLVRPGDDLGWPIVAGAFEGGDLVSPAVEWTRAIAPAGMAVSWQEASPWGRAAFVSGLLDGRVRAVRLSDGSPARVVCEEPVLDRGFGRLRMVALAPDGSLWVGTSNRDGRGSPRADDDLLLRLRPLQDEGAQSEAYAGTEQSRSPRSVP
ncbi:PQQ-dependent sugar dehydrogenase [Gaopeijia maritima]|uniref:PQQ-dependent sugar dehydrogenase n=1 Tax=Gaopeijia maritima TaxID=3119007 RepID=UPI00327C27EF